jgi:probable rRNA maturation factor
MPDRSSAAGEKPSPLITVVTAAPGWRRIAADPEALARRAVRAACAVAGAPAVLTVLLADDRMVKRLNTDHRGKAKPTNVLSFPAGPGAGDIALALETVRREARAEGKRAPAHLAHLVVHGTLHLLGHDHLGVAETRRMERAETRALRRLGLPDPWRRA